MAYVAKELKKTADISRGRKSPRRIAEYTAGFLAFLVLAYFAISFLAFAIAVWIPDSWEAKASISEFPGVVKDDERLDSLKNLLDRLLLDCETRDLPFAVFLLDAEEENAFAVPGGGIWITTGLLDSLESEAGLAFVLGHELGHHHHRHVLKRMSRSVLFRWLASLLLGLDASGFGESAYSLMELNYSRSQELEADRFAYSLLSRRFDNGDENYLEALEMFARKEGDATLFSPYLRTHPHAAERIASLRALAEKKAIPSTQDP